MMRVVFLLFAEERGLLPNGELFEQGYGIAGELDRLQARETQESEEALDSTFLAWHRLLATSQAVYGGATFESMRMPAYGGSLFDPTRFAFLVGTTDQGMLALTVSDRVMLHVLRSVQQAMLRGGEARRISFRDIDVEQIGYIYEGLLGYTAVIVSETQLGLRGTSGEEPELPLSVLEGLAVKHLDPKDLAAGILAWVEGDQPAAKPQSAAAIAKAIGAQTEPNRVSALTQILGHDRELLDRILPWLALVRLDLRGRPMVILDGGLMVRETPSRKNSGTHYTPRSLAEEVVLHALQPMCYEPGPYQTSDESKWLLKSSDDILSLKVADIACGSGAFLVSAARYIADRVVEAWIAEDPANAQRRDLHLRAIREVVANCLYGADINDMAVEMCKLSMWLVSLDRDLPFSFVDDKIFLGNSLLGLTTVEQLRKLHIDPSRLPAGDMFDIFDVDIDSIIVKAVDLRRKLATEIDELDPVRNSAAKQRQLAEFNRLTSDLRNIADSVIAAGLRHGGKSGRALDEAYENLRIAVKAAHPESGEPNRRHLDSIINDGLMPTVPTDYLRWRPLHWAIEATDIVADHGGFDAIVGNPPFLGGSRISGAMGGNVRDWLSNVLADGQTGNPDLVAYFFRRAMGLLRSSGTLGLIATNTIAQGGTREVSLERMVDQGFEIVRAIRSRPWPARSVSLDFAAVWGTTLAVPQTVTRFCDGVEAVRVSALLEPVGATQGSPSRLDENAGILFEGCKLSGTGFIMVEDEARSWISEDPRNADVLFEYLSGEDLASRPDFSASRWAIDFNDLSEADAAKYELPFRRVCEEVRPERAKNNRKAYRDYWWQYAEKRPSMRAAVKPLAEVLGITKVSKSVMPVRLQTGQIFSERVAVFATDSFVDEAVLSSNLHQIWVITYGTSTPAKSLIYPIGAGFETFPRPSGTDRLEAAGELLDSKRREIMLRRGLGLTNLYNLINSPDIQGDLDVSRLRDIHVEIDQAMMTAYGWSDMKLEHGFYEYRGIERWTVSPSARVELLALLLTENHRRSALQDEKSAVRAKGKKAKPMADQAEGLF